ncbi:MAG: HAMP domain-containing protein [Acidobacteriia bacterium]|jgi:PAS domain S-box-containing protein|nr:HAMP domain-containing protein [Terriglobia bacterium]
MTPLSQDERSRQRKLRLTMIGILVTLLAAAVFTLGSLNVPLQPESRTETIVLFALSTFIVAAFLVFLVIFGRSLLRTWAERQAGRPGSRFKWKMVMGALAISLLPIVFMFWISYGLVNRTLAKWFPGSLEAAVQESRTLLDQLAPHVPETDRDAFAARRQAIAEQVANYEAQKQDYRAFKTQLLLALGLFTIVLLVSVTWFALFLAKLVTTPIEALAHATTEVARGNFDHRVEVQAHDELGVLVESFNQMTAELADNRRRLEASNRNLQSALDEIERRRKFTEAILENVPAGVLSLDATGRILRGNRALESIFGPEAGRAETLEALFGEAARSVRQLLERALRMGMATRELEIPRADRVLHVAVTVSALGPRTSNPGFLVVIDDLTELLRAQRAAAWQEVAQRIAHEIKNPLTPIQLSAERLQRYLGKPAGTARDTEFERMVRECAALIEREVSTLKTMVDEFSRFARFPKPKPQPVDLNAVVCAALDVFAGRLNGITLHTELDPALPLVRADAELLRHVLVNLIDNAAAALEHAPAKRIEIVTRVAATAEAVEIVVADTGPGIPAEEKDLLFLPHFSKKEHGTGLGLAIASRVVADHGGTIAVEDNQPCGARFVIRLPRVEVAAPQAQS